MNKTRLSYARYSRLLSCQSEEDASKSASLNLVSKSSRYVEDLGVGESTNEFQKYTTSRIRDLLFKKWELLEEVAKTLETITISTDLNIYVVNEETNKIHRLIKGSVSHQGFEINPGSILAAYSAFTKKLQIGKSSSENLEYPLGIGKDQGQILSLPVVTPNENVIAVIDLFRELKGEKFSKEDQLIGLTMTNWLAAAYEKHTSLQTLLNENSLHQTMFAILKIFFKANRDIDKLIGSISLFIKNVMKIEKIKFYRTIIDREHWAYFYEETKPNEMTRSEKPKRLTKYKELSIVLKTKENLNITVKNKSQSQNNTINLLRREGVETILLVPIVRSVSVLGIIQLTDKINGDEFTIQDEEFLYNFCKYYSLALHYTNVALRTKRMEENLQDRKKLLIYMLQPCEHDFNQLLSKWYHTKNQDLPENFLTFSFYPWRVGEFKLMELSLMLLNHTVRDVFENEESMVRFVMMAKKVYRKIAYHNFEHAFNVTHFMTNIRRAACDVLTQLEWKALIVASFCHDMDHPGFTNNFLKATSHIMVELYQESVLENHHSYVAHLFIKEMKLFLNFSQNDYKFIMNEIHDAIIATDLSVYFKRSNFLNSIIEKKSFSRSNPDHMLLLKGVMMTTCDLSGQLKPREVAVGLAELLYEEFYHQGDEEKILGLKPISMMNRQLTEHIPNDQLDFIMFICLPCADMLLKLLPELESILENVIEVIEFWLQEKKKLGYLHKEDEDEDLARLNRIKEKIEKKLN